MKIITFFAALFFIISEIKADNTIKFNQISYSEAFELAKRENKKVFLYFHFDGCGACLDMEKTAFVDSNVAAFYNENFISLSVNTRKGEGIDINKIYNVRLHPTFLYLDENGDILHKIVGVFSPQDFNLIGKNALNTINNLAAYNRQYQQGNRDGTFLYEYCYKLRDANELDSHIINEYLSSQSVEDLSQEHNIRFIYEFAVHHFNIAVPFESDIFTYLLQNRDRFSKYFEPEQVNTRIVWITNSAVSQAIENQDELLFNKAIRVLDSFDNGKIYAFKELDGRTTGMILSKNLVLSSKMAYYEKSGNKEMYQKTLKDYIDKIWNDSDALNTIAWNYYENVNDKASLESAKQWVIRSIELDSNYANNDTYAALLYKIGNYDAAIEQAHIAILLAKKDGLNYDETIRLIELIKEKKK